MRTLGSAAGMTAEDPFGPGDPLEVARLVRRALAAARARARDVRLMVLVVDEAPPAAARARFVRRALGPHGGEVQSRVAVMPGADHQVRLHEARQLCQGSVGDASEGRRQGAMVVVLGPGATATAEFLDCAGR